MQIVHHGVVTDLKTPPLARDTRRDASLDTLVGVLIVLVVVGHAIQPVGGALGETVLQWLFMFHMPAFVFLSGYLTRMSTQWSPSRIVTRLLFPYLIAQIAHAAVDATINGASFTVTLLTPAWTTWYLLALCGWRLAAPLLGRSTWMLPASVIAALAVGLVPWIGTQLSLSRMMAFAPFFVAGLLMPDHWWERLRTPPMRVLGGALLAAALVASVFTHEAVTRTVFFLRDDYETLGVNGLTGIVHRTAVLAIGAVLIVAVIAVTGWSHHLLARIGRASLVVYLLHPLALSPMRGRGYPDVLPDATWVVLLAIASVVFAAVVSSPAVVRAVRPAMDLGWWTRRLS